MIFLAIVNVNDVRRHPIPVSVIVGQIDDLATVQEILGMANRQVPTYPIARSIRRLVDARTANHRRLGASLAMVLPRKASLTGRGDFPLWPATTLLV